jgi:hypothetical protein
MCSAADDDRYFQDFEKKNFSMTGYWLTTFLYFSLFLFFLYKIGLHKKISADFRWVAIAFFVKVLCGIAYGYFDAYSGRGGDSMNYFWDANWIFKAFHQHPLAFWHMLTGINDRAPLYEKEYYHYLITWKVNDFDYFFNDSRTLVRIHLLIRLFSFGNYTVHVVVITFLSFIGQLLLIRTFQKIIPGATNFLFLLLCFLPTSLIWFSGTMKEPIVIFGLGILLYHLQKCLEHGITLRLMFIVLSSILLILAMRFYLLVCLAPGMVLLFWLYRHPAKPLLKVAVVAGAFLLCALSFDYFATDYKISNILYDQQMNYVKKEQYYHPGKKVDYTQMDATITGMIRLSPQAFFKTLLAPAQPFQNNPYRLLFFLENCLLCVVTVWAIFHFTKPTPGALPWMLFCIFAVVLLYVLIGLTVPFEGAMVRFRSVVYPFLVFILAGIVKTGSMQKLQIKYFNHV